MSAKMAAVDAGGNGPDVVLGALCGSDEAMQRAMAAAVANDCKVNCKVPQPEGPFSGVLPQDNTYAQFAAGDNTITYTPSNDDTVMPYAIFICANAEDIVNLSLKSLSMGQKQFIRGNNANGIPACQFMCGPDGSTCSDEFVIRCWANVNKPLTAIWHNSDANPTSGIVQTALRVIYAANDDC
jgi:hypothetical protein